MINFKDCNSKIFSFHRVMENIRLFNFCEAQKSSGKKIKSANDFLQMFFSSKSEFQCIYLHFIISIMYKFCVATY